MELQNIAAKLNIESYPEALNRVQIDPQAHRICDPDWIDELERQHKIFGKYYDLVREAGLQLQEDENRLYWGQIASSYLTSCTVAEARQIPMPESDHTLAGDFLPLLILMTQLESGIAEYKKRGMPEDMIRRNLDHFVDGIRIVERRTGRPAIDKTYFNWLIKFVKAKLFNAYGFNFEIKNLPSGICILQEIKTSRLIPVYVRGTFHHSGLILNSAGCENDQGSFEANFFENEEQIIGHACSNGIIENHLSVFSKKDFRIYLRSGDPIVSVHIPRDTDISVPNAAKALRNGFKDAERFYPEHAPKALWCQSWLLDPTLGELLRPEAKIPQFGNFFTRYPVKSAGKEIFSFVFEQQMPLNQLPERTSLERSLKQHYIEGKFIHAFAGVMQPEQL